MRFKDESQHELWRIFRIARIYFYVFYINKKIN
jgi:hypothetical protein